MIYADHEKRLEPLAAPAAPRAGVIDELYAGVVEGRPPLHSGEWGAATLEVCLAIHHSFVCFLGFGKRKCFDHWTDIGEYAEIKRVLSFDRSSGETADN